MYRLLQKTFLAPTKEIQVLDKREAAINIILDALQLREQATLKAQLTSNPSMDDIKSTVQMYDNVVEYLKEHLK